jgi:hypothetical protein
LRALEGAERIDGQNFRCGSVSILWRGKGRRRLIGELISNPWPRYTANAEAPAWLIQDLSGLSTLTDAQYLAMRNCDFWDSMTATPPDRRR